MLARALGVWLPVLLWAATIVGLGSDAFGAGQTSRLFGPLIEWLIPQLDSASRLEILYGVRKVAHALEYGLLALLLFRAFRIATARSSLACAGATLALVVGLAVADERRQATSAVRTGSVLDVALDSAGGAAVLASLLALEQILGRGLWRPRSTPAEERA